MARKGLAVNIVEMPLNTKKMGAVAVVVAEWFPEHDNDYYSHNSAPITQKTLDTIKSDARKKALKMGLDLDTVEKDMCRDFQNALVDNVVQTMLEARKAKAAEETGETKIESIQDHRPAGDQPRAPQDDGGEI